jgi:S-adenosylmethionine/arginine decarboxylase-like enzyme
MHKHLVVTALADNPTNSPDVVIEFLNRLVNLVDMQIFMEPRAKYCDDPCNSGVTGDVVITTSHASIHIWDNLPGNPYPGLIQMDLYSCKNFNPHDVLDFIEEFLSATISSYQVIDRGLPSYAASAAA